MKRRLALVCLITLALPFVVQCATGSRSSHTESEESKAFAVPEGKGVVYVYRTGKFAGSGLLLEVSVNGVKAGGAGAGTHFRWELKPGSYTFSSQTVGSSAVIPIQVEAGKLYFIEMNSKMGVVIRRTSMKRVSEATGKRAVQSSKLLVSAYVPES